MIDVAVGGWVITSLSCRDIALRPALVEVTYKYPDVKFIALDMTAGDIIAAAVGNKYYEDPDSYEASDYYNTGKHILRSLPGGDSWVYGRICSGKIRLPNLGFLGGQAVPAVMRLDSDMYRGSMMRQKNWVLQTRWK